MRTHPLHVGYLVSGLVLLGIAAVWVLRQADLVELGDISWLLPLTLVLAGVLGLVAFAARNIRRPGVGATRTDIQTEAQVDRTATETETGQPTSPYDHEGQVR
jgi:hypothetical protein